MAPNCKGQHIRRMYTVLRNWKFVKMKNKKAEKQEETVDDGKEDEKKAFDDNGPTTNEHIAPKQPPTVTRNRDNRDNNEHGTLHIPIAKTIIQPSWTHSFNSLSFFSGIELH